MTDYRDLLLRADSLPLYDSGGEASDLPDELAAALRATESERKHHENTAGCLRTDLEYVTRRAEQAEARLAEYEFWKGDPDYVASSICESADRTEDAFQQIVIALQSAFASGYAAGVAQEREKLSDGLEYFIFQQSFHPDDRQETAKSYWESGNWPEDTKRAKELAAAIRNRSGQ